MKLSTPRRGVGRPSLRAWRKDKWRWQSASARLGFPWDFYSKDGGKTIGKLTFSLGKWSRNVRLYAHGTVNVYRKLWNCGNMEKRGFSKPLALGISLNLWFHRTFWIWNWHLLGGQWWIWGPQFQGHARRTGHLPTKLENLNLVPGMMAVHGDIHITNKDYINMIISQSHPAVITGNTPILRSMVPNNYTVIYIYVCVYIYIYISIYLSVYLSIYVCMYVCMYVCVYMYMYTYM